MPNETSSKKNKKGNLASQKKDIDLLKKNLQNEISKRSYEETIDLLNILLSKLQSEDILIEDLQETYIKGNACIKHCEKLLDQLEQSIIELDINNM